MPKELSARFKPCRFLNWCVHQYPIILPHARDMALILQLLDLPVWCKSRHAVALQQALHSFNECGGQRTLRNFFQHSHLEGSHQTVLSQDQSQSSQSHKKIKCLNNHNHCDRTRSTGDIADPPPALAVFSNSRCPPENKSRVSQPEWPGTNLKQPNKWDKSKWNDRYIKWKLSIHVMV